MCASSKPRALLLVGAGASVEYGIPTTIGLGHLIEEALLSDSYCRESGGTDAYLYVKQQLLGYYQDKGEAHFERIYHVLHEMSAMQLIPNAVPRFRPVMHPFIRVEKEFSWTALRAAAQAMLRAIYSEVSKASESPRVPLEALASFLSSLGDRFLPRIYTTNYDDFFEQAVREEYFTGFTRATANYHLFDPSEYWSGWAKPACFHIHGSVHMGFPPPNSVDLDFGDIAVFSSRADALKYNDFGGGSVGRMDGTGIQRSAIITGLDKLGRLQQSPFASYYAGLAREAMEADVVFVVGSGLSDMHLNTWLKTARCRKPRVPLLYVGYWPGESDGFYSQIQFENDELGISLFHDLNIDLMRVKESEFKATGGWTIDASRTAAVWADGFQSFLNEPAALSRALALLNATGNPLT